MTQALPCPCPQLLSATVLVGCVFSAHQLAEVTSQFKAWHRLRLVYQFSEGSCPNSVNFSFPLPLILMHITNPASVLVSSVTPPYAADRDEVGSHTSQLSYNLDLFPMVMVTTISIVH